MQNVSTLMSKHFALSTCAQLYFNITMFNNIFILNEFVYYSSYIIFMLHLYLQEAKSAHQDAVKIAVADAESLKKALKQKEDEYTKLQVMEISWSH